jgi:hypothetical protein
MRFSSLSEYNTTLLSDEQKAVRPLKILFRYVLPVSELFVGKLKGFKQKLFSIL